jgi:hypothetical protein
VRGLAARKLLVPDPLRNPMIDFPEIDRAEIDCPDIDCPDMFNVFSPDYLELGTGVPTIWGRFCTYAG